MSPACACVTIVAVTFRRTIACGVLLVALAACGRASGVVPPRVASETAASAIPAAAIRNVQFFDALPGLDDAASDYLDPVPSFDDLTTATDYLDPVPGYALCEASVREAAACSTVSATRAALPAGTPLARIPGMHPSWLLDAYRLRAAARDRGNDQTIAIVVAGRTPHVESDIAEYRRTFGLGECSARNGCLRRSVADAEPAEVAYSDAWEIEATIDGEIASAVCPHCRLLFVEVGTTRIEDVMAAAERAVALGATVLNLSFAAAETGMTVADAAGYRSAGIPFVAATGDTHAGATWPATAPFAIAVGGTSLVPDRGTARGWTERVWSGSSGGCSTIVARPPWQAGAACAMRATADVSAFADPRPGVAIYVTPRRSARGWRTFGGTSVAAPIVAGAIALAGNGAHLGTARYVYYHRSSLFAVDGDAFAAGLGSPNGTGAF